MTGLNGARKVGVAVAAAVVGLGAFVTTSGGSQSSPYSPQATTLRVDRGATAAAGGSYASFASHQVSLGAHKYVGGTISCPSSYPKAISGQFATGSPAVFATDSYRIGTAGWHTVVTNTGTSAATIQIGTICSK